MDLNVSPTMPIEVSKDGKQMIAMAIGLAFCRLAPPAATKTSGAARAFGNANTAARRGSSSEIIPARMHAAPVNIGPQIQALFIQKFPVSR